MAFSMKSLVELNLRKNQIVEVKELKDFNNL